MSDPNVALTGPTGFRVGSVIKKTCLVFAGNFPKFAGIAVTSAVPTLTFPAPDGYAPIDLGLSTRMAGLVSLASFLLGQSIIIVGAIEVLHQRPIRLSDILKVGLRRFPPLAGIAAFFLLILVLVLATFFFLLATFRGMADALSALERPSAGLILPITGTILLTMFSVMMPVCVIESLGPIRSLQRTIVLTRGYRWKGLLVVFLVIVFGAGFITTMRSLMNAILASSPPEIAGRVSRINAIWVALWLAFFAVFLATSYRELRAAKQGNESDQIAGVFE